MRSHAIRLLAAGLMFLGSTPAGRAAAAEEITGTVKDTTGGVLVGASETKGAIRTSGRVTLAERLEGVR